MPRRLFSALGGCCLASAFALAQTPGYELIKINSDPAKGFQWPYYLTLPSSAREPAVLLVVPNNSGTTSDDQTFHDAQARSTAQTWATQSELGNLRCPVLVPTFPRPQSDYEVYTQALDRATLVTRLPGLERIDRQLVAMISDARSRLAARGVAIDEKVWLWGFSATGSFVSRFLILHPEIVKAAFFGAGGFGPPVPLAEHKGRRLEYPWGVADLELLTGNRFNVDAFRQVPILAQMGDEDTRAGAWEPDQNPDHGLLAEVFGEGERGFYRYPRWEAAYQAAGSRAQFEVIPNWGHFLQSYPVYIQFFERYRSTPAPPATAKTKRYTLYFPHVDCGGGWETELALTHTIDGAPVQGELTGYAKGGGAPLGTLAVTLPAAAARKIQLCREMTGAASFAYVKFAADSGFVAGLATLARQNVTGRIAASPALGGLTEGVLNIPEPQAEAALGFLNLENKPAAVTLTAYSEGGARGASAVLTVASGEKLSGAPEALLPGFSRVAAAYLKFESNRRVAGFWLQRSGDGSRIDGGSAMSAYVE
jgi:dienelactone hydrolase